MTKARIADVVWFQQGYHGERSRADTRPAPDAAGAVGWSPFIADGQAGCGEDREVEVRGGKEPFAASARSDFTPCESGLPNIGDLP